MFGNRKTASFISLAIMIFIVIGFVYLYIKVNSIPEIVIRQTGDFADYTEEQMYISMPISKGWLDSGYHANQYDATLYNNTLNNLEDWTVTISLPNNSSISDSWNISYDENPDGTVTIYNTPDQGYNDSIAPSDSITFGFILFSNSDDEITDFLLTAYPEAKMTDYPLFYGLLALILFLIIFVSINIAVAIKDHQYKIRAEHDQKIIIQSMKTFTNFIDAKDQYTRGHSIRVAFYTKKLAEKMGFDDEELYNIYYIALLHDVGKINIPDAILNKPGALTKEEMDVIKTHTTNGALILKDFTSIPDIIEGAKYHHERYDGTGYPDGIKGESIPLVARVICVADAFDAMNSDRCYRKAFSKEKIISELEEGSGKQFDPDIVNVMLELIKRDAFKNMNSELNNN
ncbi:MAG: HD domain-containing protein [Lachnospiraceae bacterium]|nr:HD domain-containing protein [Lachnospiraceae bacterium]